jgi:hypothetical protein
MVDAVATLNDRYRALQQAQSQRVSTTIADIYDEEFDPEDIDGSIDAASSRIADVLTAEQRVAQGLAVGFVRGSSLAALGTAVDPLSPDDTIPGTTRAGATLSDGMGAIGSMVLGQIGLGADIAQAAAFGSFLFDRFGTAEVTGAADREQSNQETRPEIIGWSGIVSDGACDGCQDNEGEHDLDEEMYRHGNCTCTRVPVWSNG